MAGPRLRLRVHTLPRGQRTDESQCGKTSSKSGPSQAHLGVHATEASHSDTYNSVFCVRTVGGRMVPKGVHASPLGPVNVSCHRQETSQMQLRFMGFKAEQ